MAENKYFLGIDGGGSKTTAVVFNEKGEFICKVCGESINYYSVGMESARKAMDDIINQLSQKEFDCTVIGMSALCERATAEETNRFCRGIIKSKQIIMDSDLFVALEAMDTEGECSVVISGTGSMAVCRNADGTISHAGGFGYILGDEGSGYSIAINAIKNAIRAAEGSEQKTALTDKCLEFFSINNIYELIDLFYEKTVSRKTIASFAKEVMHCAENGDATAIEIIDTEAKLLSKTVLSLLKDKNESIPIGLWGGVFQNNQFFRRKFKNYLSKKNFNNVKLLNFTPELGAILSCYRNSGIKAVDIIKNTMISTYN
ncbi:MAG: hypothetical protein E7547_02990 [Ruminococcaceae bacterium]|nr:hypothetical protein [Oscillospiraceae bacterium]